MSKFIIIEGTDNVGKDTQQNLIIEKLNDLVFHKIHYSSLQFITDVEKHVTYSSTMYDDMFKLMLSAKEKNINIICIYDPIFPSPFCRDIRTFRVYWSKTPRILYKFFK